MAKSSALLDTTVEKYNVVRNLSKVEVAELDKSDVALGNFSWQVEEGSTTESNGVI